MSQKCQIMIWINRIRTKQKNYPQTFNLICCPIHSLLACPPDCNISWSKVFLMHKHNGQKSLKYKPHKEDVPPIYLLIKKSQSSGSRYFSRCLYMMFALVWMHFEVNLHIPRPLGSSNIRRRWNGAMSFGPWYLILTLVRVVNLPKH